MLNKLDWNASHSSKLAAESHGLTVEEENKRRSSWRKEVLERVIASGKRIDSSKSLPTKRASSSSQSSSSSSSLQHSTSSSPRDAHAGNSSASSSSAIQTSYNTPTLRKRLAKDFATTDPSTQKRFRKTSSRSSARRFCEKQASTVSSKSSKVQQTPTKKAKK